MRHLRGGTRLAFLCFFASHIPITLLVDGQAVLPESLYPSPVLDLVDWYAATFKDGLMTRPFVPWFKAVVACEVLLQLPFFFFAVYALWTMKVDGRGTFRSLCLIYGSHTATTLVPILATIAADGSGATTAEKAMLMGFYLPYLAFPLWLVFIAAGSEDVFGGKSAARGGSETGMRTKVA